MTKQKFFKYALCALALSTTSLAFAVNAEKLAMNPDMAVAFKRDLGLSDAKLADYLKAEQAAVTIEASAKQSLGERFAGSWIETLPDGKYRHMVAVAGGATAEKGGNLESQLPFPRAKDADDGVFVIPVQYSLAQLEAGLNLLDQGMTQLTTGGRLPFAGNLADIHSWYVDVQSNRVVITAPADATEAAVSFAAASGLDLGMVSVQKSEGVPTLTQANVGVDIFGGRQYSMAGGSCSIGFAVRSSTGVPGFITAGHCGGVGTQVFVGGQNVGIVQARNFPGDDMAWANVRANDRLLNEVDQYNGTRLGVAGNQEAAIGAAVCRSGFMSQYRCGTIRFRNVSVNYGGSLVTGLTQSTACTTQGDSGGSWITPAGQAQGVTSGGLLFGSTNCTSASPQTYFQPLQEIQIRYGLTLAQPQPQIAPDAYEVDDTPEQFRPLFENQVKQHNFHRDNDTDWSAFAYGAGVAINIRMTGSAFGQCQMNLYIHPNYPNGTRQLVRQVSGSCANLSVDTSSPLTSVTSSYFLETKLIGAAIGANTNYSLLLTSSPLPIAADQYEVDDTLTQYKPLYEGSPQQHNFHRSGDVDWTAFAVGANVPIRVTMTGNAAARSRLRLYRQENYPIGAITFVREVLAPQPLVINDVFSPSSTNGYSYTAYFVETSSIWSGFYGLASTYQIAVNTF